MAEYTPNSHRYKEAQKATQEKRVEKVVAGNVKTRKKSGIHKVADSFFAEDFSSVKSYALYEVFIPGAKRLLSEVFKNTIDAVFGTNTRSYRDDREKISYRKYSDHYRDDRRDDYSNRAVRSRFDYDDIVFENRAEADIVLERMCDTIERYGYVTIADMYDMAGLSQIYTSNRYGWTSLRTAEVVRDRDGGYIIKLPKAQPID